MTIDRLIWAVVAITCAVIACITALTIWGTGDNTAAITSIIGVATPALSVLILLIQGQKTAVKVEEAKREASQIARKVEAAQQQTARTVTARVEETSAKVDEIKNLVTNGRQEELQKRISELEERLRRQGG